MKKYVSFSATLASMFFVLAAFVPLSVSYADGTNTWHSMAQWQRNQAIVDRAYQDLNSNVGVECKEWVRTVIKDASGSNGHVPPVNIPPNNPAPYDYYWQNDPYGNVSPVSMYIRYVEVGNVVQMRLASGTPHTAIVVGNNGYSVTFIDSNWFYISAPTTVKTHSMTYEEFYEKLEFPGAYVVYYM